MKKKPNKKTILTIGSDDEAANKKKRGDEFYIDFDLKIKEDIVKLRL